MATGDIWRVNVRTLLLGRSQSFGICYTVQTDATDPDDGDYLAEAFWTHCGTEIQNCMSDQAEFNGIVANPVYPEERMVGHHFVTNTQGADANEALPVGNAACFQLHQTAGSPKNNGSLFVGGCPEDQTDLNVWKAAFITTLEALATKLETQVAEVSAGPGRWDPCVVSKTFTPPSTPKGTALDVTSVTVAPQVCRQSRRRRRFGWSPLV